MSKKHCLHCNGRGVIDIDPPPVDEPGRCPICEESCQRCRERIEKYPLPTHNRCEACDASGYVLTEDEIRQRQLERHLAEDAEYQKLKRKMERMFLL